MDLAQNYIFYAEANVVCIIIFALMLFRDLGTVGRQTKQIVFVNIVVTHMIYFSSDIVWGLILGGIIPRLPFLVVACNAVNLMMLCALTAFWFMYVEMSQGETYINKSRGCLIIMLPAIATVFITLFLFIVFPRVMITEEEKLTTVFYILFVTVPILYVIAGSVRSFVRAFRKENYAVKKLCIVCGVYPLVMAGFGVVQTFFVAAPIFCFGMTIMMLYFYMLSLNDQVSIDELTRLNNRTQLKKYIVGESLKQGTGKTNYFVLMVDLNKFKQINDSYGHVEGDLALKRTADALKMACSDNIPIRTFIARYGGDEFIIIAKTDDEQIVSELCAKIKTTMERLNTEAGAPYELKASIGYASYQGDIAAFQQAVANADKALYKEKNNR